MKYNSNVRMILFIASVLSLTACCSGLPPVTSNGATGYTDAMLPYMTTDISLEDYSQPVEAITFQ